MQSAGPRQRAVLHRERDQINSTISVLQTVCALTLKRDVSRGSAATRVVLALLFVACAAAPLRGDDAHAPRRRLLGTCSDAQAAFYDATNATGGGACATCPSAGFGEPACGVACPLCVNATETYLSACSSAGFTSLNYGAFVGRVQLLAQSNDCRVYLSHLAESKLRQEYCSKAFHHVRSLLSRLWMPCRRVLVLMPTLPVLLRAGCCDA